MSTAPATIAGAPAAPEGAAAAPAAPAKIETVPKDIRNRVLSGRTAPAPDPKAADAKAKADKDAADKKIADDLAAKKKADEDAAAAKAKEASAPRVRKVKDGPALPENPPGGEAHAGKSVEQLVRDTLPGILRENAPAEPAIDPEVQREIDLATFAERKAPDRYTGLAAKVKSYFTAHDDLIATKAKELGGIKSGEFKDWIDSEEYKNFVAQNRPSYVRGDRAKMAEDLVAERARDEARREMQPEMKALERQTAELKHQPVIQAKTQQAVTIIITDPNEVKDPALEGFAKDPVKFGEDHPEEAQLIAAEASDAVEQIREIYRIDLDLVDFNAKAPTPIQAKIRDFSVTQNATLRAKHPTGIEMGDGKILIDADTYRLQGLHKNPKYRVFTADELAGMLAVTRNSEVLAKLKRRRDGVAKSIYAPKVAAPPAAPSGQEEAGGDGAASPTSPVAAAPGGRGKPPTDAWAQARRKALSGK